MGWSVDWNKQRKQILSLENFFLEWKNMKTKSIWILHTDFIQKSKQKKIKKITKTIFSEKRLRNFLTVHLEPVKKVNRIGINSSDEINACIELYVRFVGMVVANDKSLFRPVSYYLVVVVWIVVWAVVWVSWKEVFDKHKKMAHKISRFNRKCKCTRRADENAYHNIHMDSHIHIHSMVDKDSNDDSICNDSKIFSVFFRSDFSVIKRFISWHCTHIRMLKRLSNRQLLLVHFQVSRSVVFPKRIVVPLRWQQLVHPEQRPANRAVVMQLE